MTSSSGAFADSNNKASGSTQVAANEHSGESLAGLESWQEKSISDQLMGLHHGSSPTSTKVEEIDAKPRLNALANEPLKASLLELPPTLKGTSRPPRPHLHPLQEWEGYVLSVGPDSFTARILDLTAGSTHEEEEAEIPIQEISDRDRPRIQSGAIFRWVIGYERSTSGVRKRVSVIVFRDLPAITERDLQEGRAWADETRQLLGL
ncbi:MAG: hypothetical protein F4X31_12950 [Gammaproteobacteria bacterium]|nr:hypothetical protein [Gammaproteobacteria bacterium]